MMFDGAAFVDQNLKLKKGKEEQARKKALKYPSAS